jgi:hypothetical protein
MPPRNSPATSALVDSWGRQNNRRLADKICQVCGTAFRPLRISSKFCSRPCLWSKNGGHNRKDETWWTDGNGYIAGRIRVNGQQRNVKQHRVIVERVIGRALQPGEDVHHINGDKQDNRPENLAVLDHREHAKLSNKGRSVKKGHELTLSTEERLARAERMRLRHAKNRALKLATGG